jgi:RNA polymerase sigma factor (sigma-70 family)
MPEDHELVNEVLGGSQAAMEVLTRKYYKPIFSFVYRKVGNKDIAYELTQDIFIKVVKRIQSYSRKGEFKSWIFSIAINHCRDYWKSATYKHDIKQLELPDTIESEKSSVTYIFERKLEREEVKMALDNLPNFQKEAIILKYYHHMKISEISEITNSSIPTVKSRLKQGLGKMAKMLKRGEDIEQQKTT